MITAKMIPHIEVALGFKLYSAQIDYLLHDITFSGGRATGKTSAYMIKLALSDGEPIVVSSKYRSNLRPDGFRGPRYEGWFRSEFLDIHRKLTKYGFKTRRLA